jgi:hypothetical protein
MVPTVLYIRLLELLDCLNPHIITEKILYNIPAYMRTVPYLSVLLIQYTQTQYGSWKNCTCTFLHYYVQKTLYLVRLPWN